MVVSVVMGFLYMLSVSLLCCLVTERSRKLVVLLISAVGVNCRDLCMLFIKRVLCGICFGTVIYD